MVRYRMNMMVLWEDQGFVDSTIVTIANVKFYCDSMLIKSNAINH